MDIQAAFNIAMGLISALGGWWMKTIYDALRDLRNDHSRLQTQVQQVEVVVAGAASELSAMLDDWARLPHDVKNATSKAVFVAWHENIDTDMTTRCQRVAAAVMAAAKSANA